MAVSAMVLIAIPGLALAQQADGFKGKLDAMVKRDQEVRKDQERFLQLAQAEKDREKAAGWQGKIDAAANDMMALDAQNQEQLESLIAQHGWPTKNEVGSAGMTAIFLIVQHAGLEFQLKYFPQLRKAADNGDIARASLALLEDRISLRQGKPQIYGSQVDVKNGVTLRATMDEAHLDARRKTVGLEPICNYLAHFKKTYGAIVYPACVESTRP